MQLLTESKFDSFTLYFLAYDHSNGKMSKEEFSQTRFNREGACYPHLSPVHTEH
jgi:lactoylglutathione lyase